MLAQCLHKLQLAKAITSLVMVTYKLILDQRRIKPDGKCPISIRVTYERKTKNVYTGISVTEQQWDFQSNLIKKKLLRVFMIHID